jgi:hypothetical protein
VLDVFDVNRQIEEKRVEQQILRVKEMFLNIQCQRLNEILMEETFFGGKGDRGFQEFIKLGTRPVPSAIRDTDIESSTFHETQEPQISHLPPEAPEYDEELDFD